MRIPGCLLASLALLLASAPARALELQVGDLVVSDPFDDQIVRVDPETGAQQQIAQGGHLDQPLGIAIAPDGMLWAANFGDGKLVEIDPADGSQTPVTLGPITAPRDVEVAPDGTLWVVGPKLWKVERVGSAFVVNTESEDLAGNGPGQALAYVEASSIPDGLVLIAAGLHGALTYDVATQQLDPFGLYPQPAGASVNGVAINSLPFFTQSRFDAAEFACDQTVGGLYAGSEPLVVIAQGDLLTCPRRLVATQTPDFDAPAGTGSLLWYVTDVKLFDAETPPRVVRVAFPADLSPLTQEIVSEGTLLDDPWDIEIVPEPDARTIAACAIAALLAHAGARLAAAARRSVRPAPRARRSDDRRAFGASAALR